MATAITEDFVTKNGIVVQGTSAVTSSTGQSNALQVDGGAAIAKNIIVGTTATIHGVALITNATAATTSSIGALVVTGGIYAASNLIVAGTNASTSTLIDNSLYVAGGVGIANSLFVHGPAVFENDVVFNGETTYVYSTNSVYTDNLIELHVPEGEPAWTVDDGKDIGLRFHYFTDTSTNAALVLANDTKFLEWYGSGAESQSGTFSSATYGTFKTGSIVLTSTASAISTITGALQVVGGIAADNIYGGNDISGGTLTARNLTVNRIVLAGVNGQLTDFSGLTYDTSTNVISASVGYAATATNIQGGATGSIPYQSNTGTTTFVEIAPASGYVLLSSGGIPVWSTFDGVTSGRSTTASNIAAGADMQIPYQVGVGSTGFEQNFRYDYLLDTFRTVNAVFTGTTQSVGTNSGALQVVGGVGIGANLWVGGDLSIDGGDLNVSSTTFNLANTTATTVNVFGAATTITIGASTGTTNIRNNLDVDGNINIDGSSLTVSTATFTIANTAATTVNAFGAATLLVLASASGTTNIRNNLDIDGDVNIDGGDLTTTAVTFNLFNTTATTVNAFGASTSTSISSSTGITTVKNNLKVDGVLTAGIDAIIEGDLAVNGGDLTTTATTFNLINTTATTVNFAGAGTAISIGSTTGYTRFVSTANAVSTITGALQVVGGIGVGRDLFVGGDITTNQTTFNLLNATASTINFAGAGTAITIGTTTGYTEIKNSTTLTNTTVASSTNTGALQVRGGAGIGGNLYVGGTAVLSITTSTTLNITGASTFQGVLSATEGSNATLVNNGAVRVTGGVGISRDVVVGGAVTAGVTGAATSGTSVSGFYSNNTLLASFTSVAISGTGQVSLDAFSSTVYRSARYFIQIVDGANVHISEISLFHDGVKAYLSEYGISTNNGQLGSFDATWDSSNVTVKFTPVNATAMVIKMTRTTITL